MKKLILISGAIFTVCSLMAQQGTITSSLGNDSKFIEGISPVLNKFTIPIVEVADGTEKCTFTIKDIDNVNVVSKDAVKTADKWEADFDMGLQKPNSKIVAKYFDVNDAPLDSSDELTLTIFRKPDWLTYHPNSKADVVGLPNETDKTIEINCVFGLKDTAYYISDSVKLLGGKKFGYANDVKFKAIYNYGTGKSEIQEPQYTYYLDAIGFKLPIETISESGISLTAADPFNFILNINYNKTITLLDKKIERNFPTSVPGITVGIEGGIKIEGSVAAKISYQQENSEMPYGFSYNNNPASFAIGGIVTGEVAGNVKVFLLGSARAALIAKGRIGIEHQYKTIPEISNTIKAGGDIQISGKISIDGVAGSIANSLGFNGDPAIIEGNIWPKDNPYAFGDGYPTSLETTKLVSITKSAKTYQNDWFFDIPTFGAQPAMATRGNDMAVVWMEADANENYLKFVKYDTLKQSFPNEKVIVHNDNSIQNPQIALLADGDAIITWTQNRFDAANPPSEWTFDKFIDGQDIWYAIFDAKADSVIYKSKIADNDDIDQSLSEGAATVTAGKGNEALITWVASKKDSNESDIYYAHISKTGDTWEISTPQSLDLPGANYAVKVAYADDTHATAIWLSDADNADSTNNNKIMVANWDGTQFSAPEVLIDTHENINYNEIDLDFNENYGALAYTYEYYDAERDSVVNDISVKLYDNAADKWLSNDFIYSKENMSFKLPKVSIDETGFASLILQSKQSNAAEHEKGNLEIFVNDISADNDWTKVDATSDLTDSSTVVWAINAGFTSNKDIFVLTQESDTIVGNEYQPKKGILFGEPSLGLVLRGVKINSNYAIEAIPEPTDVPTGIKILKANTSYGSMASKCYPNPATDYLLIEFDVKKQQNYSIVITDLTGRKIDEILNAKLQEGVYKTVLDVKNYNADCYFYSIQSTDLRVSKQFIVSK